MGPPPPTAGLTVRTSDPQTVNERLGDEQRALLSRQPAIEAARASVVEGRLAVASTFLPRAKMLCAELAVVWPREFEDATRAHLQRRAGITIPGDV